MCSISSSNFYSRVHPSRGRQPLHSRVRLGQIFSRVRAVAGNRPSPGCVSPGCVSPGCVSPGCVSPGCVSPACLQGAFEPRKESIDARVRVGQILSRVQAVAANRPSPGCVSLGCVSSRVRGSRVHSSRGREALWRPGAPGPDILQGARLWGARL